MASDPFAKVRSGESVSFNSLAWNAMLGAGQEYQKRQTTGPGSLVDALPGGTIVRVKNETGDDLPRNAVLGLDGPIFSPTDSLDAFLREVSFRGITPALPDHRKRYVVTLEPAPVDRVIRAHLLGVCPVRVDMIDPSHGYANVTDATTDHLTSSRFGHARILWSENEGAYYGYDTGVQWAIVLLGATDSCVSIGIANGDISPRSGSSPGSGNVDLYRLSEGVEDGPLETIAVYNDSQDTFPYSDAGIPDGTRVSVAWDADGTAWVAPLECESV